MRYLAALALFAFSIVCVSSAMAGAKADSIAFQGRLTDASDNPVPDGPKDLTLSLWTDSVGGTMLHSEVVVVTVSKGLYSTCIGCASSSFFDLFTDQSVYLETQLAGSPPMTPRTALRSVPFSVSSSGVHSLSTNGLARARGMVVSRPGSTKPHATMRLENDDDGDGHPEFAITDSTDADGSIVLIGHDFEDDGILDNTVSSSVSTTDARLAIKTKGTSAKRLSTGGDCDDTDATWYGDCDDDGDGLPENGFASVASSAGAIVRAQSEFAIGPRQTTSMESSFDSASMRCVTDLDKDGIPDLVVGASTRSSGASLAIKTKGTGAQRFSGGTDCDDTDAIDYLDCDDDGDGIAEVSVSHSSSPDSAKMTVEAMKLDGGMPNRISMNVSIARTTQSGTMGIGQDGNNDGDDDCDGYFSVTPVTSQVAIKTKGTGADANRLVLVSGSTGTGSALHRTSIDDDGDSVPESEISSMVTPTTSAVAIKTKGTGADKNRTAGSSCDDSLAVNYLDIDDDGDGILEAKAVSSVSSLAGGGGGGGGSAGYAATGRWYTDSDDDGLPEGDIEAISLPLTSSVAIKTKGTGADPNRVSITQSTDTTRALSVMAVDLDGDGLTDRSVTQDCDDEDAGITVARAGGEIKIRHKGWDGTIKGRMAIETGGTIEVDFGGDGVGYVSQRFGIGVLSPTNPLEHSSGAHLTAGGVWTNASDENLKENFQQVDGAELLEKIDQLPISEWNYKTESDEVKHIGPTAQDFQKIFGVGSDGKSISTIDPSGIALAAIKELKKENSELKKQIEELSSLKAEVEQLKKLLVEKK